RGDGPGSGHREGVQTGRGDLREIPDPGDVKAVIRTCLGGTGALTPRGARRNRRACDLHDISIWRAPISSGVLAGLRPPRANGRFQGRRINSGTKWGIAALHPSATAADLGGEAQIDPKRPLSGAPNVGQSINSAAEGYRQVTKLPDVAHFERP